MGICIKASESSCSHKSVVLSVKLMAVYVQCLFTAALYTLSSLHYVSRILDGYQYQIATSSVGAREHHREPNAL